MQKADANGVKYATRHRQTTNEDNMIKYEQNLEYQYTVASDGETIIVLPALVGMRIVQIEREIKPLLSGEYSFNAFSGQITMLGGVQLSEGETLFILYAQIVTS